MKKKTMTIVALVGMGGVGTWSSALAHDKDGDHHRGAHHEFKMMDTDGDGKLSADEHAAGARKMFEMMDADKDGKVAAAEMTAAHHQVTGKKAERMDMSSGEKIKLVDT